MRRCAREPAPRLALGDVDGEAVAAALRRPDLAPRHRELREMVRAAGLGFDLPASCAWSGRALPRADAADRAALEQAVTTPPRTRGRPFDL